MYAEVFILFPQWKMSNSGINFKAYYVDGENSEVKRFFVDNDTVTSFLFMEEKLKCVFPSLKNGDFRINWKGKLLQVDDILCNDSYLFY